MASIQAVGIDLGTTNSVVACVNQLGHTVMLRDREGQIITPSVVLFDDDRTIVGEEARLRGKSKPQRLAACVKRDMGQDFYSQSIGGTRLPPEVIQACILNKLRLETAQRIGPEFGVVLAVPAYFNDVQRRVTAEAGEIAGLHVLDVLNEPVAAALAFGEHTALQAGGLAERNYFLVYDLGGFTFETTIIEVHGGVFTTVATDRDNQLGGHDWDLHLVDYLAEQFIRQHQTDPREDPAALDRLLVVAHKAKLALGIRPTTTFRVQHGNQSVEIGMTRDRFAHLTSDLLERTIRLTEKLLDNSGLKWTDLSRVLLVGGGTRMPAVRQMLKQRTLREPDDHVNAEEVVARGAAIYAHSLLQTHAPSQAWPGLAIANVNTHSLGIEGTDVATGKRVNKILIPRGTTLPARVKKDFALKTSGQTSITITVLEGERHEANRCVVIGRAVLRDLPAEMNQEWPVEITYQYASNGRISVDARVRYTDHAVHLETTRPGGISATHRERWMTVVQTAAGLAAYRAVLLQQQREARLAPIAVSSSSPDDLSAPDDTENEHPVVSFLKRYMPFAFRRSQASEEEPPPQPSGPSPAAKTVPEHKDKEPPMLEILD